jgi:hypothetical protein
MGNVTDETNYDVSRSAMDSIWPLIALLWHNDSREVLWQFINSGILSLTLWIAQSGIPIRHPSDSRIKNHTTPASTLA